MNPDTLNLIEENGRNSLEGIGTEENHLNSTGTDIDNGKEDLMKLKSSCKAKDAIKRTKWQSIEWENIFSPAYDRRLISKLYK